MSYSIETASGFAAWTSAGTIFTWDDVCALHQHVQQRLVEQGAWLDAIAVCPHGPDNGCDCRKPLIGMTRQIETQLPEPIAYHRSYTWTIDDANGEPVHLFQWEWMNPKPDEEIVRVVAEHDGILDVSLSLFAVSGRNLQSSPD